MITCGTENAKHIVDMKNQIKVNDEVETRMRYFLLNEHNTDNKPHKFTELSVDEMTLICTKLLSRHKLPSPPDEHTNKSRI